MISDSCRPPNSRCPSLKQLSRHALAMTWLSSRRFSSRSCGRNHFARSPESGPIHEPLRTWRRDLASIRYRLRVGRLPQQPIKVCDPTHSYPRQCAGALCNQVAQSECRLSLPSPRPSGHKATHFVCAIMLHKLGPCDAPGDFSEIVWGPESHTGCRVPLCGFPYLCSSPSMFVFSSLDVKLLFRPVGYTCCRLALPLFSPSGQNCLASELASLLGR